MIPKMWPDWQMEWASVARLGRGIGDHVAAPFGDKPYECDMIP